MFTKEKKIKKNVLVIHYQLRMKPSEKRSSENSEKYLKRKKIWMCLQFSHLIQKWVCCQIREKQHRWYNVVIYSDRSRLKCEKNVHLSKRLNVDIFFFDENYDNICSHLESTTLSRANLISFELMHKGVKVDLKYFLREPEKVMKRWVDYAWWCNSKQWKTQKEGKAKRKKIHV